MTSPLLLVVHRAHIRSIHILNVITVIFFCFWVSICAAENDSWVFIHFLAGYTSHRLLHLEAFKRSLDGMVYLALLSANGGMSL